jgi:hypothetical protein
LLSLTRLLSSSDRVEALENAVRDNPDVAMFIRMHDPGMAETIFEAMLVSRDASWSTLAQVACQTGSARCLRRLIASAHRHDALDDVITALILATTDEPAYFDEPCAVEKTIESASPLMGHVLGRVAIVVEDDGLDHTGIRFVHAPFLTVIQ